MGKLLKFNSFFLKLNILGFKLLLQFKTLRLQLPLRILMLSNQKLTPPLFLPKYPLTAPLRLYRFHLFRLPPFFLLRQFSTPLYQTRSFIQPVGKCFELAIHLLAEPESGLVVFL